VVVVIPVKGMCFLCSELCDPGAGIFSDEYIGRVSYASLVQAKCVILMHALEETILKHFNGNMHSCTSHVYLWRILEVTCLMQRTCKW